MNVTEFQQQLAGQNIHLTDVQLGQFETYYKTLVEWNEKMNLTAITDKEEVYAKHFFDSITAAFYFDFNQDIHICDVGAGAGFPSIPLKICFPNLKVTIVDSLQKRITFLNQLANDLHVDNVAFYHDRAEQFGQNGKFRGQYDVVMARAVARMSVLTELCLPLCKTGGTFIAMKGPKLQEELTEAENAIQLLGGKITNSYTLELPNNNGERNIVTIDKIKKTPNKYPRKPGVPNKNPIS